jgi:hypothetical protein
MLVRVGKLLHEPREDLDATRQPGSSDRGVRSLDVDRDRVDADADCVVRFHEPDQVLRVPAACVEDHRPGSQVLTGNVVKHVGAARVEALVEERVHAPRLLAVHP